MGTLPKRPASKKVQLYRFNLMLITFSPMRYGTLSVRGI